MSKDFAGLTAIVTGAGSGIGLEVARKLNEQGANVFGFDLRAGEMGGLATFIECDIANPDSVKKAFAEFTNQSKSLDILINNAALFDLAPIVDITRDSYDRLFSINVAGTLFTLQAAARQMISQGHGGKIINMASQAGRRGEALVTLYCASKAAIISACDFASPRLLEILTISSALSLRLAKSLAV